MVRKTFWFVILILQQNYDKVAGIGESENFEHLDDCISHTLNTLGKLKTTITYTVEKNDLVSEVLKKIYVPVVLNAVEIPRKQGLDKRTPNELVLVLDELNVQGMLNDTLWNGNTLFFVVRKNLENASEDFKTFWKFKIVNVYEVVQNDDGIKVYSFLPFAKDSCGLEEPFLVDEYLPSAGKFLHDGKAFKDPSRIKNMNGCPVNITIVDVKPNVMFHDECGCNGTTHLQGIEANVINEIAKKLNFNATFVIAKDGIGWGWIRPSPHGVVGEVYTGRSDFGIGLLAPTIERFESLDLSLPYNGEECITYGVPTGAGASTPNWITILFFEFNPAAWVLILISFISIIITFRLVNNFLHMTRLRSRVEIILFSFSTFLGMSVRIPSYLSFRLPMVFWIIFSFVVTIAYKSSMGSKLTVPNKDPDINTFQELLNSKLELTGYNNMLRLLQYNDKEPVIQAMIDRFKVTDFDIDFAVDYIASGKKIAYVRHTTTFLYYALINPKARGHIHVIKDCIYLFHPLVVAKKYSPFTNRINIIISRLMESGITKRWRTDYIYKIPPLTKPFLKLSNDQMYGVFCILGFGYALSLLTFLIEIIYRFHKQGRISFVDFKLRFLNYRVLKFDTQVF